MRSSPCNAPAVAPGTRCCARRAAPWLAAPRTWPRSTVGEAPFPWWPWGTTTGRCAELFSLPSILRGRTSLVFSTRPGPASAPRWAGCWAWRGRPPRCGCPGGEGAVDRERGGRVGGARALVVEEAPAGQAGGAAAGARCCPGVGGGCAAGCARSGGGRGAAAGRCDLPVGQGRGAAHGGAHGVDACARGPGAWRACCCGG